jgi:hypothetical protein
MKKYLTGMFLLLGLQGLGQVDTLIEDDIRKIADRMFENLNPNLYGNTLINRSFSSNSVTQDQLSGNYNQIHGINEFFQLYQDIALSYKDSTYLMTNSSLVDFLYDEFEENEDLMEEDELVLPFGFLIHNTSFIDSSKLNDEYFSVNQFKLTPLFTESNLYEKRILKSATILEFYPDNGYTEGYLKYVDDLISTSPDITNLSLQVNLGTGYEVFGPNSLIKYDRTQDSIKGSVAFQYQLNGILKYDTISFYVTTIGEKAEKSSGWDYKHRFGSWPGLRYRTGIKTGCGNVDDKYRRPFIIVPPYRPKLQLMSLSKYYEQFNYSGIIDELVSRGYDVIFIKQKPGNVSLEQAGDYLASFIRHVNTKKNEDYPNEHWENIIMGYSMGGQLARYALKKLEKDHMDDARNPHHHTRLYIPFDSPHHGANIPMFTQIIYYDMRDRNFFAMEAYKALIDEASKDMSLTHILAGYPNNYSSYVYSVQANPAQERINFMNALNNNFNHQFTPMSDQRKSFPSFTRNVAVSTGSNTENYTTRYSLYPNTELFTQNAVVMGLGGLHYKLRRVNASKYASENTAFRIKEQIITFFYPITIRNRDYRMVNAYEWDMAQGGYKDEFYNKNVTGIVSILRWSAFGLGQKHYDNHVSFLPLVSALAINPGIWQNNNLFYNLKNGGLMYQNAQDIINQNKSDLYGYPHLAHPTNHFQITPFEAVYCDPQTYEHIKMQASIDENAGYQPYYLETTRDFILNETEAADVYLQNKVIGKNHNQSLIGSGYKYKAWYKAENKLTIGKQLTPKTDPGDYVIEKTGDITVYAGNEIHIKPGFHSANGSSFHAFIENDCPNYGNKLVQSGSNSFENSHVEGEQQRQENHGLGSESEQANSIRIYPNPSSGEVNFDWKQIAVKGLEIYSSEGLGVYTQTITNQNYLRLHLKKGIYFCNFLLETGSRITKKVIIL